jgi:acyl-coenzyme A thioesterase PaaI-like protein
VDVEQLADISRRYIDRLVSTQAPEATLQQVAELVAQATALLDEHVPDGPRNMYEGFAGESDYLQLFRLNPVIGTLNPVAPRFDLSVSKTGQGLNGTEVEARTCLGLLYEGPVGMVHGGIIASLFDQFLSIANIDNGLGAFTGTLTIRYRQPCPLDVELRFACRTDRVEDRKVFATGELYAGDVLVAEAEGVFILPSERRLAELVEEQERLSGPSGRVGA